MDNLDTNRWQAVERRDERSAGLFIYAVTTTGIYCRPSCVARRPLRNHVEFFSTPSEAALAGYRACQRCTPDQTSTLDPATAAVVSVCRRLESDHAEPDVAALAALVGYSERHLRRLFVERVGVSIGIYQRALLAERARVSLQSGVPVTQALIDAGYGSSRAFYEHGATRLGMSPGRYRDGGRGERIGFTSLVSPIGVVVVARTAHGVCSISVGADDVLLHKQLANEFPNALIERDDEALADVALVLAGAVRGKADPTKLPLDLQGTAFQIRVWEALRTIPTGQTRTYGQVAELIGEPKAVRAVGTACGKNPAAITVPCHRVVRSDGSLGGYRWGLDVKEALLAVEGARTAS